MFHFFQPIVLSKFYIEVVSVLRLGFYMLTGRIFCVFFLFHNFWRCLFFVDNKDYHVLCNMGYRKGASFLLSFSLLPCCLKILLLPIISLRFLFLLYAIIGFPWNAFFSLGLIYNKCQFSSMIFLMFGKVLLNFSTSKILGLFAIFCFEFNKAFLVTSDIWLNWSVQFVIFKPLSYCFKDSRIWRKGLVCKSSIVASNQVI